MADEILYAAIPTRYHGVQFRSRLEARYACMFDAYSLEWEYEPFELECGKGRKAYIPDFLLTLPSGVRVLWECKPAVTVAEFRGPARRIARSGWNGPAVIAGSSLRLVEGRADLTIQITEAAGKSGFFLAGRNKWPGYWGPYPFDDVFSIWRECGNTVQWNPSSSSR